MSNGAGEPVLADAFLGENGALQEGWLGNLPEDTFEKDDTGKAKQGDLAEHKNMASLTKSYMNAQKLLGTAIQPLADDATPEQKRAHFTKLGCPEKVEGYEVVKTELPEGMVYSDELIAQCKQFAFDTGMPKGIFEGLTKIVTDGQIKNYKEAVAAASAARDKAIETASNELKAKWGAEYDPNIEKANRFYDMPGDDAVNKAFTDLMAEHGLNSHPVVLRFFHEAYKLTEEESTPGHGSAAGKTTESGQLTYPKSPNMQK